MQTHQDDSWGRTSGFRSGETVQSGGNGPVQGKWASPGELGQFGGNGPVRGKWASPGRAPLDGLKAC
ncbi:unnamed protein product [Merluccius merluccius]